MKIKIGNRYVWINYHHLYCFFVIAREGGIAKASEALAIGRSALSIQIKQFEESLGTKLFDRSHRKIVLNESGKLLYSYAKEIFRLGNEMIEVIHDKPTSGRVHLQVGVLDTIPKHLTVHLVKSAIRVRRCSVSVHEGKSAELVQRLRDHQIDLFLTNSIPVAMAGTLIHRQIARLPLWVVGDRSYLPLKKNFPESLNSQKFVMPTSDSLVRQEVDSFFKLHKIMPDIIAEAQDVMVQKLIAVEGVGLTVVPRFAVQEFLEAKKLFLIGKLDNIFEDLFIVSASRRIENPIAAELMSTFKVR